MKYRLNENKTLKFFLTLCNLLNYFDFVDVKMDLANFLMKSFHNLKYLIHSMY